MWWAQKLRFHLAKKEMALRAKKNMTERTQFNSRLITPIPAVKINKMVDRFDIVVVGGGHAGAEAAWAAGRMGASIALITMQADAIGRMSCNPAIGGIGKGQMVREIDALGGIMGLATDRAGIQFRMLNRSKGPAVWAPRAQCDRDAYPQAVQDILATNRNITVIEGSVEQIETSHGATEPRSHEGQAALQQGSEAARTEETANRSLSPDAVPHRHIATSPYRRITGVLLADGRRITASAVILTTGTFLRGLMHCGEQKAEGGRIGEAAATGVSAALLSLGFELGRLKTGTPPRIHRDTIDYAACEAQPGDEFPVPFSAMTHAILQRQIDCWITWTNAGVHDQIRANLHRAPMYSGQIESRGPRYCPSIEDKVVRFADKDRHQVFLEPEGYDNERVYCNGISTSLPKEVQDDIIRAIPGLERAKILQHGYAVEYDFVPTHQTKLSLESKLVGGLFLAGQINGTSGYEEAAGQGFMAGVNAVRAIRGEPPFVLGRDQAYIGVMIDDLITKPPTEPYRMFTSRAEYRLLLRADNADQRLTPLGRELGTVDDARWSRFENNQATISRIQRLVRRGSMDGSPLSTWMRRPEADLTAFADAISKVSERDFAEPSSGENYQVTTLHRYQIFCSDLLEQVLTNAKYSGYVDRQSQQIDRFRKLESMAIPIGVDYATIPELRFEARETLTRVAPATLGQAARVSGVNPADITVLWIHLTGRRRVIAERPARPKARQVI